MTRVDVQTISLIIQRGHLVGRRMKPNDDDTTEIFAIWEYDSYEGYQGIEEKVRSDEAHRKRVQDWYDRHADFREYL